MVPLPKHGFAHEATRSNRKSGGCAITFPTNYCNTQPITLHQETLPKLNSTPARLRPNQSGEHTTTYPIARRCIELVSGKFDYSFMFTIYSVLDFDNAISIWRAEIIPSLRVTTLLTCCEGSTPRAPSSRCAPCPRRIFVGADAERGDAGRGRSSADRRCMGRR